MAGFNATTLGEFQEQLNTYLRQCPEWKNITIQDFQLTPCVKQRMKP